MAHPRIRCPACGTPRHPHDLGVEVEDGKPPTALPDVQAAVVTLGGRGRCAWDWYPVPRRWLLVLRDRLRAALAQIDEALEAAPEE